MIGEGESVKRPIILALTGVTLLFAGACTSSPSASTSADTQSTDSVSAADSGAQSTAAAEQSVANSIASSSAAPSPADAGAAGATGVTETSETPSVTLPTEPVTPPGGGDINQTVAEGTVVSLPPVDLGQTVDVGNQITASVTGVDRITGQARLPGEIAGPALAVKVTITNGSAQPLPVSDVTVTLQDSAGTPATSLGTDPYAPFQGSVDASQAGQAVYVFSFPAELTMPVTITVNYSASAPVAVFTGNVP